MQILQIPMLFYKDPNCLAPTLKANSVSHRIEKERENFLKCIRNSRRKHYSFAILPDLGFKESH